jgi:hypothetical protein
MPGETESDCAAEPSAAVQHKDNLFALHRRSSRT